MINCSNPIVKCVCSLVIYCSLALYGLCSQVEPVGKAKDDEPEIKVKETKPTGKNKGDKSKKDEPADDASGDESNDTNAEGESTENDSEAGNDSTPEPTPAAILEDDASLKLVVDLMKTIRDDSNYHSYFHMVSEAFSEHTIQRHKPNAPFFYSNDKDVLKDIINMVMNDPSAIIDETKSGVLKVYRDFEYPEELEEIFAKEDPKHRVIPQPKKFQDDYLGLTNAGPTNRAMITLRIKSDDQNASTFAQRIAYTGNNIQFSDASPEKGPPPPPKPGEKKSDEEIKAENETESEEDTESKEETKSEDDTESEEETKPNKEAKTEQEEQA